MHQTVDIGLGTGRVELDQYVADDDLLALANMDRGNGANL